MFGLVLVLAAEAYASTNVSAAEPPAAYESNCSGCHQLDRNGAGPKHRGVFGRTSGSLADYAYSPALKAAAITWNRETLDRWLQGPRLMVPGTKMLRSVPDPAVRKVIIDYLEASK